MLTLARLAEAKGQYTPPDFLRPYHLLTFALVLKRGNWTGVTLPEHLENYANRMGLWEAANLAPPKLIRKYNPAGRFQPVTALIDLEAVGEAASKLSAICTNQAVSPETVQSLEVAITELLENCYAHAKTSNHDFHGLAAAQAWFNGDLAQIAIADVGVGIRARLMDNPNLHELLSVENACELATRYGVTADQTGAHAGYGLTLAADLLQSNGGSLMVVSKNEAVVCNAYGVNPTTLKVAWDGTLVIFEWNTSRPLDAAAVYRKWPTIRGYDDDDLV
ncbi:MAG: ATP-binding protein [Candidatus Binataceae bacterium]